LVSDQTGIPLQCLGDSRMRVQVAVKPRHLRSRDVWVPRVSRCAVDLREDDVFPILAALLLGQAGRRLAVTPPSLSTLTPTARMLVIAVTVPAEVPVAVPVLVAVPVAVLVPAGVMVVVPADIPVAVPSEVPVAIVVPVPADVPVAVPMLSLKLA